MIALRRFFLGAVILGIACSSAAAEIAGAGSSAAKPLYAAWSQAYTEATKNIVGYDPIGSSGGVKKIKERSVDFGATDVAMSRIDSSKENLICFPTSVSGVVPFVNVPGIKPGKINLTGPVLADIYMGKIRNWNDHEIAELNGGLALPNLPIKPIARVDGSGTTFNFSDYLSKVSPDWSAHFGTNYLITWSTNVLQVKGSDSVVATVGSTTGSIGYADYSYVLLHHLVYTRLQNHDGKFVEPSFDGFTSALTNSSWKTRAAFDEMLTDKPGAESWPITAGTFVLVSKVTDKPEKTVATLKFFTWGFMHGDEIAKKIGYVRLTDSLQAKIFSELTTITDKDGGKLQWDIF